MLLTEFLYDKIGPEIIVRVYDPSTGMRGILIIDTTAFGIAVGGIRMLPDITTEEIAELARIMTYKAAIFNIPVGGAKGGIWADPSLKNKETMIMAYGRAISSFLKAGIYVPGADMGTSDSDVQTICNVAGTEEVKPRGLGLKMKEGLPLEHHFTGFGVVIAAKTACELVGLGIDGSKVAIEGFGKVGEGVARYMVKNRAKIVAVSTVFGAIYNPEGLNFEKLLEGKKRYGDNLILRYKGVERIKKEQLFELPVDILVPGARPYVINVDNASKVKARVICPGANIPVTDEAEEMLLKMGIISVPDFIANGGGLLAGAVDRMSGGEEQAFDIIEQLISSTTKEVLLKAKEQETYPRAVAVRDATERIMPALQKRKDKDFEEVRQQIKNRLKI